MLTLVRGEPAEPMNDTGTYYRLDESLRPVECDRTEWEAFLKTKASTVAITNLGAFASVATTFEGIEDGFREEGEPHLFMTMIRRDEHSEAEGHRTWHEAEAAHRERVAELKALFERLRRAADPQGNLL
jgi:hypothetical protein